MQISEANPERVFSRLVSHFLAFVLICVTGCSRAVVAGYSLSPAKTYCVYGRIYGGYGRSFVESSNKTVRFTIVKCGSRDVKLFSKEYAVRGSNVGWSASWQGDTNVIVLVFEYPPGANQWDLSKHPPTNNLLSLTFKATENGAEFLQESESQSRVNP